MRAKLKEGISISSYIVHNLNTNNNVRAYVRRHSILCTVFTCLYYTNYETYGDCLLSQVFVGIHCIEWIVWCCGLIMTLYPPSIVCSTYLHTNLSPLLKIYNESM